MAIVAADGLSKSYRNTSAIKNIGFAVEKGEVFGIIGPDGAGKTTLLRTLTGVLRPDRGRVSVCGFDTVREPESVKERIGVVPQNFSLYPDLTVEENLAFFGRIYGISPREFQQRRGKLLSITRLEPFGRRRAEKLSGGMQKKLALICSLLHTPELLVLDEPTTGVDPVSRRELWDFLHDLVSTGITIVVSTPYMDEAERCSRVGFLYAGEMLMTGTPAAIKNGYSYRLYEVTVPAGSVIALARDLRTLSRDIIDVYPVAAVLHVTADKGKSRAVEELLASLPGRPEYRPVEPSFEDAFIAVIRERR